MTATAAYRRDIDGLRSLAIVPVLLYHTHVPGFTGGYVGVDIFFVISGYLITGIIAREIDLGTFSLVRFYERRARRILPALFAMIAVVLAVASWLYLPADFALVPQSMLMALLFVSNIWAFLNTGYFNEGAKSAPLLHCWSLAVEEQFYIGFPILLWLIARYMPRGRGAVLVGAALLSLAWAIWKQTHKDGFAFYMLPPRAWELFAGALLATGTIPAVRSPLVREILAATGLCLIAFAVFAYNPHTVFPGVTAIVPVLGSALLIHCAPQTAAGRLLSLPLPVGIGLISYSLYLWHWPLVVFTEYATSTPLAGLTRIAVIAASLVMAWLSWRFVERPFRDTSRFSRRRIFGWSGAGMAVLAGIAAVMIPLGGWNGRFSSETLSLAAAQQDVSPKHSDCLSAAIGGDRPECTIGAPVPPIAALLGDSHGVEMAWMLGQELARNQQSLMQRTRGNCPPLLGYAPADEPGCPKFNEEAVGRIAAMPSIKQVYLTAFWGNKIYQTPASINQLNATIARLQAAGKAVVLIGPVPNQHFNVPRRLALASARGDHRPIVGTSLAQHRRETDWLTRNYPRWQAQGVAILDPLRALQSGDTTRIVAEGVPLYFDSHHLSLAGAKAVLAANPQN
jgi:peptidoglycan/LPS O-acetylase OafA/YrhL